VATSAVVSPLQRPMSISAIPLHEEESFRVVPTISAVRNARERSLVYKAWICRPSASNRCARRWACTARFRRGTLTVPANDSPGSRLSHRDVRVANANDPWFL
jgi:hypothetical protein